MRSTDMPDGGSGRGQRRGGLAALLPIGVLAAAATSPSSDPGPSAPARAQDSRDVRGEVRAAEAVPFSDGAWSITAAEHRIETFGGRETLWLRDGRAELADAGLGNGVLEFDLLVSAERGFAGALWHRVDADHYEHFYVRSHLSGKPDASQYQPVFHGLGGWQIYTGPTHCAPVTLRADQWMHLRIEVHGGRAQVFLDGEEPVLVIDELGHGPGVGGLGLVSGFAPARFANVRFERRDDLEIRPAPAQPRAEAAAPLVRRWSVSDAFPEAKLVGSESLDPDWSAGLGWRPLEVEANGIANLARIQPARGANTALARLVLEADESLRYRLPFGFSDRVRLYHDGELLLEADDTYTSRDYRFLGTVGLHDTVVLALHPGRNVIDLAVSESFGGWAAMAQLTPHPGVRLAD